VYKEGHKGRSTPLSGIQNQPEGFDLYPDRLRWWIIHPNTGEKIVL
jgi:hypothetical protein